MAIMLRMWENKGKKMFIMAPVKLRALNLMLLGQVHSI